jgi:hypothetical protein
MRGILPALLCLAGAACHPAPPRISSWQTAPSLIIARSSGCAVSVASTLYALGGGWTDATTALTSVEFATIGPKGRPNGWQLTARMSTPRVFPACVALNGYLYAIGGERFSAVTPILLNSVERAPILPDGNLGLWEAAAPLTTPRRAPTAIASHDAIYVTGGYNGGFLSTTERARLQPDGTLGPWEVLPGKTTMPRYIHAAALDGNAIYLLGGHDESTGMATNRTEWARLLSGGDLTPWTAGPLLRSPRFLAAAAVINHQLFLFGGSTGRQDVGQAETSAIRPNSALAPFTPLTGSPPARSGAAVIANSRTLYLIGGLVHNQATASVYYAATDR